jgi:UV DNA damage repair endonuclease
MAVTTKRGGRKAGTPNKATALAKDNILAVFNRIGGTAAMAEWAIENKTEFYRLYSKLIPVDMNHSGSAPIQLIIQAKDEGL